MIDRYEKISLALDCNEHDVGVFLDLSEAFHTVDHNILLDKLEHYGICGLALDWVRSYLSKRLQFFQCSSPQTICCGVPQGSILGPLFLLLHINDLNNVSTLVELILFADYIYLCPRKILSTWQPHSIPDLINYPLGLRRTNSP